MTERPLRDVVIGLGANLGDREATLRAATASLSELRETTLIASSRIRETAPIGPAQPHYLNAAVLLRTSLEARELLHELLAIEKRFGRERRERWGARTLDLDVLWIDGEVIHEPGLDVPHAHLRERIFALEPLLDVVPNAEDEERGEPFSRALARLRGDF